MQSITAVSAHEAGPTTLPPQSVNYLLTGKTKQNTTQMPDISKK